MSEHPHSHDHGDDQRPKMRDEEYLDPANKSLADALRVSFRLLTLIMILLVLAFLLTGVKSIKDSQVGIIKNFGRVVGSATSGLTYTWPFPIGQIEIVGTDKQTLTVDDFWLYEPAPDKPKLDLLKRRMPPGGLRAGWDGAFLTGDRNLLHMRLVCNYVIKDPIAFGQCVGDPYTITLPGRRPPRVVDPKEEFIRSAVCEAAIRAAAAQTADGLQRGNRRDFARAVMAQANESLKAMGTGLEIRGVLVPISTWPLKALRAYRDAQKAGIKAEERKNQARSLAEEILGQTAGGSYERLVGRPWELSGSDNPGSAGSADVAGKGRGLIDQYASARRQGDEVKAAELLKQIDTILVSGETTGDASTIIAHAASYATNVKQRVQGRLERYEMLLPEFKRSRRSRIFLMERLWRDVRDEILASPGMEKLYLAPGTGKTVIRMGRDPRDVRARQIEDDKASAGK